MENQSFYSARKKITVDWLTCEKGQFLDLEYRQAHQSEVPGVPVKFVDRPQSSFMKNKLPCVCGYNKAEQHFHVAEPEFWDLIETKERWNHRDL